MEDHENPKQGLLENYEKPKHGSVENPKHGSLENPKHGSLENPNHGSLVVRENPDLKMSHNSRIEEQDFRAPPPPSLAKHEVEEDDAASTIDAASIVSTATSTGSKVKICQVCGDKALGFNFNALTCGSCRAFFRRNAPKTDKEFKCPFEENCEVTVVTRRFCQKCRLRKCFDIGMKKEWILSDEEKQAKRQKIEQNKNRKRVNTLNRNVIPTTSTSGQQDLQHPAVERLESNHPAVVNMIYSSEAQYLQSLRPQARVTPSTRPVFLDNRGEKAMRFSTSHQGAALLLKRELNQEQNRQVSEFEQNQEDPETTYESVVVTTTDLTDPQHRTTTQTFVTTNTVTTIEASTESSNHRKSYVISPELVYSSPTSRSPVPSALTESQFLSASTPLKSNSPRSQNLSTLATAAASVSPFSENSNGPVVIGQEVVVSYSGSETVTPSSNENSSSLNLSLRGNDSGIGGEPEKIIPDFSDVNIDNLDDIVAVAIEAEFHVSGVRSAKNSNSGKALNEQETARLTELYYASRHLVEPLDEIGGKNEPSSLIGVINLTELAVKRVIRMAKKITPFITMCQEDQIALIKGGCTELMILRSVINYNPDKNSWRLPAKDDAVPKEVRMELLKEASNLGVNLFEEHQRFARSFDSKWRTDENVMLILSAISLFNPKRVNVKHYDVVKLEQDAYFYLLKRYLETAVSDGCDARHSYLHLIGRLQDLRRLNDSHIKLFLEVNPKLIEPLLIEIFDLKPGLNSQHS